MAQGTSRSPPGVDPVRNPLEAGNGEGSVARLATVFLSNGFCEDVQWHDTARSKRILLLGLSLLAVSRDITSALAEEGVVIVGIDWDPTFQNEVGAKHGDELYVFRSVLEKLFGQRSFHPLFAFIIFVHSRDFGFMVGPNMPLDMWRRGSVRTGEMMSRNLRSFPNSSPNPLSLQHFASPITAWS